MSVAIHPNAQEQYRIFREMVYAVGLAEDVRMMRKACVELMSAKTGGEVYV